MVSKNNSQLMHERGGETYDQSQTKDANPEARAVATNARIGIPCWRILH